VKKIAIRQRYRPYSHLPGARCLLPGTCFVIQAFPTLIRVEGIWEQVLDLRGPVHEFTLQQDLEQGCVSIWGIAQEGPMRLKVQARAHTIEVTGFLNRRIPYQGAFHQPLFPLERLSLGSHRAQDWPQLLRRFDLREILPVLFHLGQWTPPVTTDLLEIELTSFLRAHFSHILVPRVHDDEHQGLQMEMNREQVAPPCAFLSQVHHHIRGLFFRQKKHTFQFLPRSSFTAGRMTDVRVEGIGLLDFEWRERNRVRSFMLRATHDGEIRIAHGSFRVRTSRQEKSFRVEQGASLSIHAGGVYFADRFYDSR
jgi:hypothetical protein